MNRSNVIGRYGEDMTAYYLKKLGYEILQRNFRVPGGEIDIISSNNEFIVFTEVKTRDVFSFERGEFAIDDKKKERIRRCAEIYLERFPVDLQPRFDIAVLTVKNMKAYRFYYYDNAF